MKQVDYLNFSIHTLPPILPPEELAEQLSVLFGEIADRCPDFRGSSGVLSAKTILALLELGTIGCLAFSEGQLIGVLLLRPISPVENELMMGIHPTVQHQGIGNSLLEYSLSYAHQQGIKSVCLMVLKENIPACHLYKGSGFYIVGESSRLIGGEKKAILFMEKKLI